MINIEVLIRLFGSLQTLGAPHPSFSPALLSNLNLLESWAVFMIEELTLSEIKKILVCSVWVLIHVVALKSTLKLPSSVFSK